MQGLGYNAYLKAVHVTLEELSQRNKMKQIMKMVIIILKKFHRILSSG